MKKQVNPSTPAPPPAVPVSPVELIAKLVRSLCISHANTSMYGLEHPVAAESVHATHACFDQILQNRTKPLVISAAEEKLLFEGLPVEEHNSLVAAFARTLEQAHIDNLFFSSGLTMEETIGLHRILAQGANAIVAHGGIKAEFEREKIKHIETKQATYILVTEDERVVGKKDSVVGQDKGEAGGDKALVEYMVGEVLKKADQKSWLMTEIKNRPQRIAQSIVEGIELATSQSEMGIDTADESIGALVTNIKQVAQSLLEQGQTDPEDTMEAEEAIMMLEKELRTRAGGLTSSKVAGGFINEILGIITSFSDQARAQKVSREFLRGEGGLKRVESLLRNIQGKAEPSESLIKQLREMLTEQGVDEKAVDELIDQIESMPKEKEAEREPGTQTFDLDDGADLAAELEKLEGTDKAEEPLQGVYEINRDVEVPELNSGVLISDKGLIKPSAQPVAGAPSPGDPVERRNVIINASGFAVVIWDYQGRVEFISDQAALFLGTSDAREIRKDYILAIRDLHYPGAVAPPDFAGSNAHKAERALLAAIEETVRDAHGVVIGAFLSE